MQATEKVIQLVRANSVRVIFITKIPDGLLYPILAAFRTLLVYDDTSGKYKWRDGKNPIDVWNKNKVGLTKSVMDLAGSLGDKPTVFGKDPSLWNYAYMVLSAMEGITLV